MSNLFMLAQSNGPTGAQTGGGIGAIVFIIIELGAVVLAIAGMWKVFEKAGHPGWAAIVPIYNGYVMLKVAGRDGG